MKPGWTILCASVSVIRPKHLDPTGARVKATYEAIGELYRNMAGEAGRKTIVWITHGVPTSAISTSGTPVDYMPTLKKFASGLGRGQVVIYPVQQTVRAYSAPTDSSRDTLQAFPPASHPALRRRDTRELPKCR